MARLLDEKFLEIDVRHQFLVTDRIGDLFEQLGANLVFAFDVGQILDLALGQVHDHGVADLTAQLFDLFLVVLVLDAKAERGAQVARGSLSGEIDDENIEVCADFVLVLFFLRVRLARFAFGGVLRANRLRQKVRHKEVNASARAAKEHDYRADDDNYSFHTCLAISPSSKGYATEAIEKNLWITARLIAPRVCAVNISKELVRILTRAQAGAALPCRCGRKSRPRGGFSCRR